MSVQPIEFQNVVKPTINHKPSAAYHFYTFYQSGYKVPATINRMPKYYQLGLHWVHHTRITLANSGWNSHWQGYIGPRRQRNHRRTRTAAPHSVATAVHLSSIFRRKHQLLLIPKNQPTDPTDGRIKRGPIFRGDSSNAL